MFASIQRGLRPCDQEQASIEHLEGLVIVLVVKQEVLLGISGVLQPVLMVVASLHHRVELLLQRPKIKMKNG